MGRLETQEIDMAEDVFLTPSQAKQLTKNKHLALVRTPDINWFHGSSPYPASPGGFEFRRAWQHSLDREFWSRFAGKGRPGSCFQHISCRYQPLAQSKLAPIPSTI